MTSRRLLPVFLLMILLALATNPLLAQSALTQSEHTVDANGLTLSVSFPDGWKASADSHGILLATSASALDELNKTGLVTKAGEIGMIVSLPNFMDALSLPYDAPADQAVSKYLENAKLTGTTVRANTDFSVPAATAVVTPPNQTTLKAIIGAMQFPEGTIIIGVIPDSAFDATALAIFNSVKLEAPADIPAVTPDSSVSLKSASFNYLGLHDSATLTLGLPDGWVIQYSDHAGILYLGNSEDALKKASAPDVTFTPGEVAITIALPHAIVGLGIPPDSSPDEALSHFQTQTKAQGRVVSDTSFGVPAAHARLTGGNLPDGGGDGYALRFDQGLVFIVVQPSGLIDGTVMAILQSIHLTALSAPAATEQPGAPATEQSSAQSAATTTTTIPVTQPNGAFELSFDLPDGWLAKPSESGTTINIGNSADALRKASATTETLGDGEIGLQIGLPQLITQLGLAFNVAPVDALNGFINAVKGKGTAVLDSSFSVPAAHGTIQTDIIPGGSVELYALAFDGGTLLIAVQPAGVTDDALLKLLKSIRFTPSTGTPATPITEATALPAATATPITSAKPIRQWATYAVATSQYGDDQWSASQATGKPNTEACGDQGTAWASEDSTGRAVLRVAFDQPVLPSQINIYQSFTPGAIVEVDVGNSSHMDKVMPLPHSADPVGNTACPGVFSLDVSGVDTPIDFIAIYIDQSLTGNWNEIDAVELVGTPAR